MKGKCKEKIYIPADQPEKHCPNCNGTGILAYCDLCSGTGEKPPTREDFRYMEGLGKQSEGEGFVENLDLQPEKHCTHPLEEDCGKKQWTGCEGCPNLEQPTQMPPLVDYLDYVSPKINMERQREVDMAWNEEKVRQQCTECSGTDKYPTIEEAKEAIKIEAVKEFAEKCMKTVAEMPTYSGCPFMVNPEDVLAHIRAMAEE